MKYKNLYLIFFFSLVLQLTNCKKIPEYEGIYPVNVPDKKFKLEILSVELKKYPYYSSPYIPDTETLQDVYLIYGDYWFEINSHTQNNFSNRKIDLTESEIPYKFTLTQPFVDTLTFKNTPKNFRLEITVMDDDPSPPNEYWEYDDELLFLYAPAVFKLGLNKIITEDESAYVEYRITEI